MTFWREGVGMIWVCWESVWVMCESYEGVWMV